MRKNVLCFLLCGLIVIILGFSAPANADITYTINATAGEGGTIGPSGNVLVSAGTNQFFNLGTNKGYAILDITIDGVTQRKPAYNFYYTFSNVTQDHSISATFIRAYTTIASCGAGVTLKPSGRTTALAGESKTFTISVLPGYEITDVLVDGESKGSITSFTFSNVSADHTLTVLSRGSLYIEPGANANSALGMNLNVIDDWSDEMPFVDIMRQSRVWTTSSDTAEPLNLDENGWPISIPAGTELVTLNFTNIQGRYQGGIYTVFYEGSGKVRFYSAAEVAPEDAWRVGPGGYVDLVGPGSIKILVTPLDPLTNPNGSLPLYVAIKSTDSSDIPNKSYLHNMRILMPGHESTYQTQPFNPRYLDLLKRFSVIRFLNWTKINTKALPANLCYVEDHPQAAMEQTPATITLAADDPNQDTHPYARYVQITGGPAQGEIRIITGYNNATKIAQLDKNWKKDANDQYVLPTALSTYRVYYVDPPTKSEVLLSSGQAQQATTIMPAFITLSAPDTKEDGYYTDTYVTIMQGPGSGQTRKITAYNNATKKAELSSDWDVVPYTVTLAPDDPNEDYFVAPRSLSITSGPSAGITGKILSYNRQLKCATLSVYWRKDSLGNDILPTSASNYEVFYEDSAKNKIILSSGQVQAATPKVRVVPTTDSTYKIMLNSKTTLQAGTTDTVTLSADDQRPGDYYKDMTFVSTKSWDSRLITGYNSATKQATIAPAWTKTPAAGEGYIIYDRIRRWNTRITPDYYTQTPAASYELMIALCNTLNASAWFNLPYQVDDDSYYEEFAKLLIDKEKGLKTNLKAYIEYANECWNYIFPVCSYVKNKGFLELGKEDPALLYNFTTALYYQGRRSAEMFQRMSRAIGEPELRADRSSSRLVRVIAAQRGGAYLQLLDYPDKNGRFPFEYADAFSVADYFGHIMNSASLTENCAWNAANKTLTKAGGFAYYSTANHVIIYSPAANQRGLYEIAQATTDQITLGTLLDDDGTGGVTTNQTDVRANQTDYGKTNDEIWDKTQAETDSYYTPTNIYANGSVTGATKNTVTIPGAGYYYYPLIELTSGPGTGQVRHFNDFDDKTKTATVFPPWEVIPDNTTQYKLCASGGGGAIYRAVIYARARGLDMVSYEAGTSNALAFLSGSGNLTGTMRSRWSEQIKDINFHDPRGKSIYLDNLNKWKNLGVDKFGKGCKLWCTFSLTSEGWGHIQYMDEDEHAIPRWQALEEFMDNNPAWWDDASVIPTFKYGDVSGDGLITAYDAAIVAQAAASLITFTADQTKAANVSGDGEVTGYDAALIAQRAIGLIQKFPVE